MLGRQSDSSRPQEGHVGGFKVIGRTKRGVSHNWLVGPIKGTKNSINPELPYLTPSTSPSARRGSMSLSCTGSN